MINHTDFHHLVEKAMQVTDRRMMRPAIEKELLHYDILFALDDAGLLDQLTFQGGTALRLCYQAPRYSEDLDFAGGLTFERSSLTAMRQCLEEYIGQRYQLAIHVKEPKTLKRGSEQQGISVDKWQIAITTAPKRKDLPKQKIKIEVASIAAYSREPRSLHINYDFLPDGYGDLLILTETLSEIMADKIISLVNSQRYVRYRDIWDLYWLLQQNVELDIALVQQKSLDYSIEAIGRKIKIMREKLPELIESDAFKHEMTRFIPLSVQERTLGKEKFRHFLLNSLHDLLSRVQTE